MYYRLAKTLLAAAFLVACLALMPMSASAATKNGGAAASGGASAPASTGGVSPSDPQYQPTGKARIVNGLAVPPADAPPEVVAMINAANSIATKPYKYGGGHADFEDNGYDCSGTVSFVLHGAGLLDTPLDSSSFMKWGEPGKGKWVTVYTNPGHAFIMIAGLRFDTGFRSNNVRGIHPGKGPRWGKARPTRGFKARHPEGF
jgi:cell wall-associated NlpC family hydrolase